MAIIKKEMYGIECDNCKEHFVTDNDFAYWQEDSFAIEEAQNYEWHIGAMPNEPDYCDLCHSFDDDDNLIINADRKK